MKPNWIVVHQSKSKDHRDGRDHIRIDGWHHDRKFPVSKLDYYIGYHYVIQYNGRKVEIKQCRLDTEWGAHARGFNRRSIGICVVGDYDKYPIENDKKRKLIMLNRILIHNYKIPLPHDIGHRSTYALRGKKRKKSCPGNKFSMKEIREAIRA